MNQPGPRAGAPAPGKLGMLVSLLPCMVAIVVAWYAVIDRLPRLVLVAAMGVYLVSAVLWLASWRKYRRYQRAGADRDRDAGRES